MDKVTGRDIEVAYFSKLMPLFIYIIVSQIKSTVFLLKEVHNILSHNKGAAVLFTLFKAGQHIPDIHKKVSGKFLVLGILSIVFDQNISRHFQIYGIIKEPHLTGHVFFFHH